MLPTIPKIVIVILVLFLLHGGGLLFLYSTFKLPDVTTHQEVLHTSTSAVPSPTIASPSATLTPAKKKKIQLTPTIIATLSATSSWQIRSVSSMKETKDKICGQDSADFIQHWVEKAVELGVNYISIETPYEDPSCGYSLAYTREWVKAIRARGLHVWHRHMPLAFEGIYNQAKAANLDTIPIITSYIHNNHDLFAPGDIFTPIPEPQNGGIQGVTYCSQSICEFSSKEAFNAWLRSAMTASEQAFSDIGLGGQMKVGYFGFDGFVTWGDNNPDWHGILEDATVSMMGNITIDHYPEAVGDTMSNDLNELQAKYPTTPIVIGEWGTITGGDTVTQIQQSMGAALRPHVIGFNYWHMGMGGNESLLNDDFSEKPGFAVVKSFFSR